MQGQSNGSLSGVIIESKDSIAMPGVQVYVKTKNGLVGMVTDINGHFTLKPLYICFLYLIIGER